MITTPTLTQQEFSSLDEGLRKLKELSDCILNLPAETAAERLQSALDVITTQGVARIYAAEKAETDELDQYYREVAGRQGLFTTWGVYSVKFSHFGDVPHAGAVLIAYVAPNGVTSGPVRTEEDPSWVRLWKTAEKLISDVQDPVGVTITGFRAENGVLHVLTTSREDTSKAVLDQFYDDIGQRYGLFTTWRNYSVKIGRFADVPHKGICELTYTASNGTKSGPALTDDDPSWLRLWRDAEMLISNVQDPVGVTITGFRPENGVLHVVTVP